jgi:hypothetical protein
MVPAAAALLLMLQLCSAEAQVAVGAGPPSGCPDSDRCGNVSVPYPFAISHGCSLPGFELTCDITRNPPRLMVGNGTLQVVDISLANSTVRALDLAGAVNITYELAPNGNGNGTWASLGTVAGAGPYVVSEQRNRLVVTGCNVQATLAGENTNIIGGCSSFCPVSEMFTSVAATTPVVPGAGGDNATDGGFTCSGTGCCETPIAIGRPSYLVQFLSLDQNQELTGKLPIAVRIAERGWFEGVAGELLNNSSDAAAASLRTPVPVVLEWVVSSTLEAVLQGVTGQFADDGNWSCPTAGSGRKSACLSTFSVCRNITGNYRLGYVCQCDKGYDGNPYVTDGCQDIDECERAEEHGCFGECTNTVGSFICRCPHGARGNATIPNGCTKSNLGN